MGSGNWPNLNGLIASQWPNGRGGFDIFLGAGASNIVIGTNAPYGPADYFALYSHFGGVTTPITGNLTGAVMTGITQTAGLSAGWPVSGPGIMPNTSLLSVDSPTQITLSQSATVGGSEITLAVFNPANYVLPAPVLAAYISLATACLVQARWQDTWIVAMGWFINHFCILWMRSNGDPCTLPGRIAAAGLTRGITASKAVAGVSQSIEVVNGLEGWAAWTSTESGVQLSTFMKVFGAGASLLF